MTGSGPAGLVLTPGASARRDQSGLVAIDQAVTDVGLTVERVDFPGPAAGKGLDVAALVLVSYPLHPPGRPERLRTAHFPDLNLPCLFVSGRRDAFAAPVELERETEAIAGAVTLVFVDGDHSLRKSESAVADIVASWLAGLH